MPCEANTLARPAAVTNCQAASSQSTSVVISSPGAHTDAKGLPPHCATFGTWAQKGGDVGGGEGGGGPGGGKGGGGEGGGEGGGGEGGNPGGVGQVPLHTWRHAGFI